MENGTCSKCSEFCSYCARDHCFSCETGFYFDFVTNSCLKCDFKHCELCGTNGKCQFCTEGYYVDEPSGKCVK